MNLYVAEGTFSMDRQLEQPLEATDDKNAQQVEKTREGVESTTISEIESDSGNHGKEYCCLDAYCKLCDTCFDTCCERCIDFFCFRRLKHS